MSAAVARAAPEGFASARKMFDLVVPMGLALADSSMDLSQAAGQLAEQAGMLRTIEASAGAMASSSAMVQEQMTAVADAASVAKSSCAEVTARMRSAVSLAQNCAMGLATAAADIDVRAAAAGAEGVSLKRSADDIQKIAREIQMLAVNAGVEAARHGASGRGFAVIAEAIKGLADQTRLATDQMGKHLGGLATTVSALQGSCRDNLDHAKRMEEAVTESGRHAGELEASQGAVAELSARISGAVGVIGQLAQNCQEIGQGMRSGVTQVARASEIITGSAARILDVQGKAERIVSLLAESGAELPIADLVELCQSTARRIADIFEQALASGELGAAELFDENYRAIEGTAPQQYLTGFTAIADRRLAELQERVLAQDARIVFCAAVDRNGYLPTHNRRFSQPQSHDPVWNAEHCRNRRIFNDRTGLASARNRNPVLLQSYRRDMGGGQFVLMNELASPIVVNGRHWGGFRMGVRLHGGAS